MNAGLVLFPRAQALVTGTGSLTEKISREADEYAEARGFVALRSISYYVSDYHPALGRVWGEIQIYDASSQAEELLPRSFVAGTALKRGSHLETSISLPESAAPYKGRIVSWLAIDEKKALFTFEPPRNENDTGMRATPLLQVFRNYAQSIVDRIITQEHERHGKNT